MFLVAYPTAILPFLLSKVKFQCGSIPRGMYLDRCKAVTASLFPFANNTSGLGMMGYIGKLQRLQGEVFFPKRRVTFSFCLPSFCVYYSIRMWSLELGQLSCNHKVASLRTKSNVLRIVGREQWRVCVLNEIIEPHQFYIAYYIQTSFCVR